MKQNKNNEDWHKLYSDFARAVLDHVLPVIEDRWERISNPSPALNESLKYWGGHPGIEKYHNKSRNSFLHSLVKHITAIKDPKYRFLSGVNVIPIVVTTEGELKTIRLCFSCDTELFKEAYFPWLFRFSDRKGAELLQLQYQIAQYAMVDMSWETFIGKTTRSLTGSVIHAGKPRYIDNVCKYREPGSTEESILPEVDDDIGFSSIAYVPILKNKADGEDSEYSVFLMIHSPVFRWFDDRCSEILHEAFHKELAPVTPLLRLLYSFMVYWEKEAKRTGASVYGEMIDILMHGSSFQDFDDAIKGKLKDALWEQNRIGSFLCGKMPRTRPFYLKETIADICSSDRQLEKVLEGLHVDLNPIYNYQDDYSAFGVPEVIHEILWELVTNMRKYAHRNGDVELRMFKKIYGWDEEGNRQDGAFLSLITKGVNIDLEKYMSLRLGMPSSSAEGGGFGMWLAGFLVNNAGGILKTRLFRNHKEKDKGVGEYRKGLEVSLAFPIYEKEARHGV